MQEEKKRTIHYSAVQGSYWILAAISAAYAIPLLEAKGYTSFEIGVLNGIKYVVVVLFQPWIAGFSDRNAARIPLKYIIALLSGISIIIDLIYYFTEADIILAIVIFILFGVTLNCISPLIDSLSIQYMNHKQQLNYTVSRACGSGTWALSCVTIGMFSDQYGINNILLIQIVVTVLLIIVILSSEKVKFDKKELLNNKEKSANCIEEEPVHSAPYLLKHFPKYTLFLFACMLIFMGYNLNATFLIDLVRKLGGNHTDFGISQFVLALAEIPTALVFMRLKKHIKVEQLMVCCAVFCTVRAIATTFSVNVPMLIAVQGFELLGLGIFYAGAVFFVMENLPSSDVVKGMSFINVATIGIGEAIASVMCGIIKSTWGLDSLMLVSIVVSGVGILFMLLMVQAPVKRIAAGRENIEEL